MPASHTNQCVIVAHSPHPIIDVYDPMGSARPKDRSRLEEAYDHISRVYKVFPVELASGKEVIDSPGFV